MIALEVPELAIADGEVKIDGRSRGATPSYWPTDNISENRAARCKQDLDNTITAIPMGSISQGLATSLGTMQLAFL